MKKFSSVFSIFVKLSSLQRIILSLTAFFFCVVLLSLHVFDRAYLDNRLGIRQLPLPANWYYMPQPAGFTIGTAPAADDPRWIRLDSPRPLPGVTPPAAVLIRADIEAFPEWADSLYIPLLFEVFELYADGRMLYSHGDPGRKTSDWFQGWPWHIIPVSPAAGVRTLLFRVYSEHPKTGLVSTPLIGTTQSHLLAIVRDGIWPYTVALVFFLLALILTLFFLKNVRKEEKCGFFALSTFAILLGLFNLSRAGSDIRLLLFNQPLFWSYMEIISLFFCPLSLISFIKCYIGKSKPLSWYKLFSGIYPPVAVSLIFTGYLSFHQSILIFQYSLIAGSILTIVIIVRRAIAGSKNARYFTASILIIACMVILDVLAAMNIIQTDITLSHWGTFLLFASFGFILAHKYTHMKTQLELSHNRLAEAHNQLTAYKNNLERMVCDQTTELQQTLRQLETANCDLQRLSVIDSLTGLYNRRHFDNALEIEVRRMRREKSDLGLIMIDIDFFKSYNDTYGHPAGDEILRQVAEAMLSGLRRPPDTLARYGGEEFAVILPGTSEDGCIFIAERLLESIVLLNVKPAPASPFSTLTISLGISVMHPAEEITPKQLLGRADAALYQAKREGRNCYRTSWKEHP